MTTKRAKSTEQIMYSVSSSWLFLPRPESSLILRVVALTRATSCPAIIFLFLLLLVLLPPFLTVILSHLS